MLEFIAKKLRSQKLLNACLFFGIMILVSVLSLIPMFEKGALDDVILYNFEERGTAANAYPAVISRNEKLESEDFNSMEDINAQVSSYTDVWNKYLELPVLSTKIAYRISAGRTSPSLIGKDKTMNIVTYNEIDTRLELIDIETGVTIDESLPVCYMPRNAMDDMGLTVGEVLNFPYLTDAEGEPISLRIAGLAEQAECDDYYWYKNQRLSAGMVVVREDVFEGIFKNNDVDVGYQVDVMLDYRGINSNNIRAVSDYLEQFQKKDGKFNCGFTDLLDKYFETAMTVKIIIISILIPLLVLLLIFIYMVSDRIRIYEESEINVLRSRGISRGVIIRQYLMQVNLITLAAYLPGVLIGFLLCKLGASSVDFLAFEMRNTSVYAFRPEMLLFALVAFPIASILFIIPIAGASKSTVLTTKGKRSRESGKNFVEKYFVDVIILGIAIYLLYNYNKQRGVMVADILSGKSMDPMVLIDAELFTFGAAFLLIRLTRLIITAIYKMNKKRWKPETLAAFLEVIRTRKKSWVISVFLIITIAMGIYNANLAKTVNHNKRERIVNDVGADIVFTPLSKIRPSGNERQAWSISTVDYSELVGMKTEGLVTEMTQVSRIPEDVVASTKKGKANDILLYGVDTMGMGKSSTFDIMNNDHHWFNDLNALAKVSNGAIISKNMADAYELQIGDSMDLKVKSPLEDEEKEMWYSFSVQVVGILDTFPGFDRYYYVNDEAKGIVEKEKNLVVINQAELEVSYGKIPQEVWMKLGEDVTIDDITSYLRENDIATKSVVGMEDEIDRTFGSAMLLITNGLFNVSFIISMIICVIGFLIYWLTSIYSRQTYFGVYRAMGMGMKRINSMLVKEHIFSTMTSLLSSVIVGILTSVLFTRLISSIYLPEKHSIPLRVYMSYEGFIRIGVVMLIALILCMVIIRRFIKKMNITEAIKLGED